MDKFIAIYTAKDNIERSILFNRSEYDEEKATKWLEKQNIKNAVIITKPITPEILDDNRVLFKGTVGFDITEKLIMPYIKDGKEIIINSLGGSLFEAYLIHDSIKLLNINVSIGVVGICASAAFPILLSANDRWASENSYGLVHLPFTSLKDGEASAFQETADMLKKQELKIATLLANTSNYSVDEMLLLMNEAKLLDAREMLQYNFITRIKPNTNQTKNDMEQIEQVKEKLSGLEALVNKVMNFINPPKNLLSIMDANGVEITFPDIDEESQIAVGIKATVNGEPANGDYIASAGIHEGSTMKFAIGKLVEIIPAAEDVSEEVAALQAENEELKEQLQAVENSFNKFKEKASSEMSNLKTKIEEFKNMVTKGNENDTPEPPSKDEQPKRGFSYKNKKN